MVHLYILLQLYIYQEARSSDVRSSNVRRNSRKRLLLALPASTFRKICSCYVITALAPGRTGRLARERNYAKLGHIFRCNLEV